jgi:hypothetical protein
MKKIVFCLPFLALIAACGAPTPPTVSISSPSVQVYTKASVTVQVVVTGEPNTVELLKNGSVLATLVAPYQYTWDTLGEAEGEYSLTARASKNGVAPVVSDARSVTVDRTPPTVVSRTPANAASNVFLADEISVTFSEPMLPSSLTTSTVQLLDGIIPISRNATLNAAGSKLTIVPTALPGLPLTLTTAINGITDRAGNVLPNSSASLNAPAWQQPSTQPLDVVAANNAGFSEIATGANGQIFVTFREIDASNNRNVYVKRWTGTTWEALGGALDILESNNFATNPDIAVQSNGNPIVAWDENNTTDQNIYVKRWTGSAWEPLGGALDVTLTNGAAIPKLVLDSSNNPFVVWSETETGVDKVYVKRWDGTAWVALGNALNINNANSGTSPQISIINNQPVVVWQESNNIYVKRWDGATWQSLGIALNTANALNPDVLVAPDGNPIATFTQNDDVVVRKWDGSTWQAVGGVLDVTQANSVSIPKLAVDLNNNPIVVWLENSRTVVKKWNGSAWVQLGGNLDTTSSLNPKIATDTSGNPVVSFTESANIFVKRYNRIP